MKAALTAQATLDALCADIRTLRQDVDSIMYALNHGHKSGLFEGAFPLLDRVKALEKVVADLERSVASLPIAGAGK